MLPRSPDQRSSDRQLTEPSVRDNADEVLRGQGLKHRHEEGDQVLVLGVLGFKQEVLVVEDDLAVHVLNQDPESFRRSMNLQEEGEYKTQRHAPLLCSASLMSHLIVPLEVRRDRELHLQRGAGDWLQVHGQVQFRELVHVLVDSLAHFWHSDELA